jgi:hypothetical protein
VTVTVEEDGHDRACRDGEATAGRSDDLVDRLGAR